MLTVDNNRILLKSKNNQASQVWMLNGKTMTMQSMLRKSHSLAMVRNGNGNRRPTGLTLQQTNGSRNAWW